MIKKLYPEGKTKAFNVTYDDGVLQDKEFVQILNKYGIKGTFNLNSELMKNQFAWFHECGMVVKRLSEADVKDLYDGHEIASHTLTHPNMQGMSAEQILREMSQDKDNLENIFGTKVLGFAVPFNYYSDLIAECAKIVGFEYARTSDMSGGYTPCEEEYYWRAGIFHLSSELESYIDVFLETDEELAVAQIVGHTYDFDAERNWDQMENLLAKVASDDKIWFATNLELVRYLKAMKNTEVTDDYIQNHGKVDVWFEVNGTVHCIKPDEKVLINE